MVGYTLGFVQSFQSGYIAGLLIGVAFLGVILTFVVAGIYSLAGGSEVTFAKAMRTGWVWAVGFVVAAIWTVLFNA